MGKNEKERKAATKIKSEHLICVQDNEHEKTILMFPKNKIQEFPRARWVHNRVNSDKDEARRHEIREHRPDSVALKRASQWEEGKSQSEIWL